MASKQPQSTVLRGQFAGAANLENEMRIRLLTACFCLFFALAAVSAPITVKVVGVSDGDTITGLDANNTQAKIRLNGVDCPESSQAFGTQAKKFTSDACFGKSIQVELSGTDRYGRHIGNVTLPDGKNLNQELVKAGMAWWYEQYAPNDATLKKLQEDAKKGKVGLWADANPTAPWEFRKGESQQPEAETKPRMQAPETAPQAGLVYVAPTGKKYHKQGCRTLKNGSSGLSLADAKSRGYTACKVCGG